MSSVYEMSSAERFEAARIALARDGFVSSRIKGRDANELWLDVRHNDAQFEHVRRIVVQADTGAVKR